MLHPQAISLRTPEQEGGLAVDLAQPMLVSPFSALASQRADSNGQPFAEAAARWQEGRHAELSEEGGISSRAHDSAVLLPTPALPGPPAASSTDASSGDLAAQIEAVVARQVEAQVGRLQAQFQKREAMLMQAVMSHAERERELLDRMAALERKLQAQQRMPPES
jgi:hypothetical protein